MISKLPFDEILLPLLSFSLTSGLYAKRRNSLQIQLDSVCRHCQICKVRIQVRKCTSDHLIFNTRPDFVVKFEINNLHAIFRMGNLALLNETLEGLQVIRQGFKKLDEFKVLCYVIYAKAGQICRCLCSQDEECFSSTGAHFMKLLQYCHRRLPQKSQNFQPKTYGAVMGNLPHFRW